MTGRMMKMSRLPDGSTAIACPVCRSRDNKVIDTQHKNGGMIKRKRKCKGCSDNFFTIEIREDLFIELVRMAKK